MVARPVRCPTLTLALPPGGLIGRIFHATLHPARRASFIFCSLMWCKLSTFMMTRSGRGTANAAPPRLLLAPLAPHCFRSRSPKRAAPSSDAPIGRPVATRAASRAAAATSAPGLGMLLPHLHRDWACCCRVYLPRGDGALIVPSLSLQAIICESPSGAAWVLTTDRSLTCGGSGELWFAHLMGGAVFVGALYC